jgi:Transmembrane protein family 132
VESTTASTTTADDIDPCRPLYQSATVEVYARFVTTDTPHGSSPYMLHRKAMFRLTDYVRDRIQLTNSSVARLRAASMAVDGVRPGQTDVQVITFGLSPDLSLSVQLNAFYDLEMAFNWSGYHIANHLPCLFRRCFALRFQMTGPRVVAVVVLT